METVKTITKNKFFIFAECAVLFIIGLAPILWFQGTLLISEDINVPKDASVLVRYFFAWDDSINLGSAPFDYFQALPFFAFQSFISAFQLSLQATQKILFVLCFLTPGLSFYYFLHAVLPTHIVRYGALPGAIFYMTTTGLIPIWQGFNIANLTGYAFGPILLAIFFKMIDGRLSFIKGAAAFGLMSFIAAGVGVNSPFLIVFAIPFVLYPLTKIIIPLKNREYDIVLNIFLKSSCFAGIFILTNCFWILPLLYSVISTSPQDISPFSLTTAGEWLDGISRRTNLLNVMRLQGMWTWTQGHGSGPFFDLYDPYSTKYLENIFFIMFSFVFPVLALAAAFFRPRIDKALFFSILAIVSIVGGAGAHLPTGPLYLFLFKTVPFLWMVRSPWYKFSFLTAFAYGALIAIAIGWIVMKLKQREIKNKLLERLAPNFPYIFIILLLIYASPILKGEMFPSSDKRKVLPVSHLNIPKYVWNMTRYLETNPVGRTLSLPNFANSHGNEWGYYGFRSIIYQISRANILEQNPPHPITFDLYLAFNQQNSEKFLKIARLMRIDHILYEGDSINKISQNIEIDHKKNENFLSSLEGTGVVKKSGPWTLYKLWNE